MANYDDRLKDYVPVNERILAFYKEYPDGCLQSEIVQMTDKLVVVRARAHRTPDDRMPGIGHSSLTIPGPTSFTRGSELENAETSAWGRAIAALGFEVKRGIASREEIDSKKDESSEKKAGKVKTKPDQDLKGVEVCRARGHHNTQKIVDAQTNETSLACVDCGKAASDPAQSSSAANGVADAESPTMGDVLDVSAASNLRTLVESTKAPILLMMKQYAKGKKYELVDGELQTDITAAEYEKLMEVLQKRKELNDAKGA